MLFLLVLLCFFFELTLSNYRMSWFEYRKLNYVKSVTMAENHYRKIIYMKNLAKIEEHNDKFKKGLVSYRLKMNQFGHFTDEEFYDIYSGTYSEDNVTKTKSKRFYRAPKNKVIPEAVNWNTLGAVTAIKTQHRRCASCYAFGVVGALESLYYIKNKKLVQFSEQQIIDCGKAHGLNGCLGGSIAKAFNYARVVGLTEQANYSYETVTGPCRIKNLPILVKVKTIKYIRNYAIHDMEAAIAFNGPVVASFPSTPIRALTGTDIFSGDTCTEKKLKRHTVVVVGYNTTADGQKYWIIKNNWGKMWGDNGYFYVDRKPEDPCGLTVGAFVAYI